MAEEIINRVANSKLVTFNLEDYYPEGKRVLLDIKDWLLDGFVLREKEFRAAAKAHDWSQYRDCFVALTCSTDAIVPGWAYMLLSTYLEPYSKKTVVGDLDSLEINLYSEIIDNLNVSEYRDKMIIIKGCSNKPVPLNAYVQII
ncbi:MAG TPA: DUF2480 family protein, partial [Salinimicrobium sp.]|nr:DUF2480 family protein [Salinimicrobium sp.]